MPDRHHVFRNERTRWDTVMFNFPPGHLNPLALLAYAADALGGSYFHDERVADYEALIRELRIAYSRA